MFPIDGVVKVEVIKSSRGFPIVIKDNYLYNMKKKGVNKLTWKCHRNKSEMIKQGKQICYAGLYTNQDLSDLCATAEGKHNHPPEPKLCDYRRFMEKVKQAAETSTLPASELAMQLQAEITDEQKDLYPPYQSIACLIGRRRRQLEKTDGTNNGFQQIGSNDNFEKDLLELGSVSEAVQSNADNFTITNL